MSVEFVSRHSAVKKCALCTYTQARVFLVSHDFREITLTAANSYMMSFVSLFIKRRACFAVPFAYYYQVQW